MIQIFKSAIELPEEWDKTAGNNAALRKENLLLLEQVNPCKQEYVAFRDPELYAVLVKYILNIDIFCYSKLNFYLPITIIGIPCSVASPGYSLAGNERAELKEYLSRLRGAKLVLNAAEDMDFLGFTKGNTLPSCVMDIRWSSFEAYLYDLRSHYRYRFRKALKKSETLSIEVLGREFDSGLYRLYEQVYDKSEYKLEKLTIDFFRQADATIVEFRQEDEPIAFVQYRIEGNKMVFLFGGLDYRLNQKYDLYQNMLLYLVKTAIENNCTSLDLGQTAEEMKCRLGAVQQHKYLYIHHSSGVINWLVKKFSSFFSYRINELDLNIFKD